MAGATQGEGRARQGEEEAGSTRSRGGSGSARGQRGAPALPRSVPGSLHPAPASSSSPAAAPSASPAAPAPPPGHSDGSSGPPVLPFSAPRAGHFSEFPAGTESAAQPEGSQGSHFRCHIPGTEWGHDGLLGLWHGHGHPFPHLWADTWCPWKAGSAGHNSRDAAQLSVEPRALQPSLCPKTRGTKGTPLVKPPPLEHGHRAGKEGAGKEMPTKAASCLAFRVFSLSQCSTSVGA